MSTLRKILLLVIANFYKPYGVYTVILVQVVRAKAR